MSRRTGVAGRREGEVEVERDSEFGGCSRVFDELREGREVGLEA